MELKIQETDLQTSEQIPLSKPKKRTDYTFYILREEHLEETIRLIYDTFTATNPLWMRFKSTYEEIAPFLRWRIMPTLATQTSSILILDGKIVGCQILADIVDYQN